MIVYRQFRTKIFNCSPTMSLIRRVAIIGGGPAGLAAAKALMLEPSKFSIDLFERRDKLGGLWYYHGDKATVLPSVPSTDPNGSEVLLENGYKNRFFSSMYNHLETNLIDRMMEYKDVPFEPRSLAFISRSEVHDYLLKYADTIPEGVNYRLKTNVLEVSKSKGIWSIQSESVEGEAQPEEHYDAIIVANGHTELPFIPNTPGLSEWNRQAPGTITHARYYKDATEFRDKTVLIIGNYASGVDLATQIGTTAKSVYVSVKDESLLIEVDEPNVEYMKLVTSYDFADNRSAYTVDGRKVSGINTIIFCTGYLYTYPFLEKYLPGVTDGSWVPNVYKQIFNVEDPTLAFVGLPKFIVPMPLSESQSALIARVYSGRLQLPLAEARRQDYQKELAGRESGKSFHSLKPPQDYDYCNEIHDWIIREGLDTSGLVPIFWDSEKITDRQNAKEIKDARYIDVVKHARKLREEGQLFNMPAKAKPIEY